MPDAVPRVIVDELVALAVHHLGDPSLAAALVERVLAAHPELAAAAVGAATPADRLHAVDRLFGLVRWAVRERLQPAPAARPEPEHGSAPQGPVPVMAPLPPPPAMPRPPVAAPRPVAQPTLASGAPPPASIPPLEPPRSVMPPEVVPPETVPMPRAESQRATAPHAQPHSAPPRPQDQPQPEAQPQAQPAEPRLRLFRLRDASAVDEPDASPTAPLAPQPVARPQVDAAAPLFVDIVDDLYGVEAASRRRRRLLLATGGLAVAAGAAWLVLAEVPLPFRPAAEEAAPAVAASEPPPAQPPTPAPAADLGPVLLDPLQLDALQLEVADAPPAHPGNGAAEPQPVEPAAGPTVAPATDGVAQAANEPVRVFIHYDAGTDAAAEVAADLYARLTNGPGYATVILRDVPYTIGRHRVRFYFAEDRPAAALLADRLGRPAAGSWELQDFTFYRPLPARGTLEVFVPTG